MTPAEALDSPDSYSAMLALAVHPGAAGPTPLAGEIVERAPLPKL